MFTIKIIFALLLLAADLPQGVSMEDFYQRECAAGHQNACEKLAALSEGLVQQKRLEQRSIEFWKDINTHELMLDKKKPDLQDAYPLVMRDFFKMDAAAGSTEKLNEERLPQCALHYHNHWLNKKLWYPANDDGLPDWPAIYIYIVDHYYGYCLKSL
jgi:hypothetical protein